jgi:hypothetical protein
MKKAFIVFVVSLLYSEAQARHFDGSGRFVAGALSPNSGIEAPEPAP